MALVMAVGMGSPIRPAFSTMEMASLAEKPMIAASRTKLPPMTASSWQATSTMSSVSPLRMRPFQPALLSSAPVLVWGWRGTRPPPPDR